MYTKIEIIKIKNFRSISSIEFKFSDTGLYVVKGPNGSGKTSIIESVVWALSGKDLKGGVANDVIREGTDQCSVELYADVSGSRVSINRTRGKKVDLVVHVDGVEVDGLHIADRQEAIYRLFNITERSLINSLIFGQRMTRFIESSNDEKRKLFDELFNLGWIDQAKATAKQQYDDIKLKLGEHFEVLRSTEYGIKSDKDYINSITKSIEDAKHNHDKRILEQEQRISYIKTRMENKSFDTPIEITVVYTDVREKLDSLNVHRSDASQIEKQIRSLENQITARDGSRAVCDNGIVRKEIELNNKEVDLHTLKKEPEKFTCRECNQTLPKSDIDAKISELQTGINKLKYEIAELYEKLKGFTKSIEDDEYNLEYNQELLAATHLDIKRIEESIEPTLHQNELYNKQVNKNKEINYKNEQTSKRLDELVLQLKYETEVLDNLKAKDVTAESEHKLISKYTKNIKEKELLLKSTLNIISELEDESDAYAFWCSVGFSGNGLKNYVFKVMLEQLNNYMAEYASYFNISVYFDVDVNGARKTFKTLCSFYNTDTEREYSKLSGGEKSRADIISAFALFELYNSNNGMFNILLMDEVFENIDDEGIEQSFEVLRQMAKETAVYLITHRDIDAMDVKYINVVNDGETRII